MLKKYQVSTLIRTEYNKEINREYNKSSIGKSSMKKVFQKITKKQDVNNIISYYKKLYKKHNHYDKKVINLMKKLKKKYLLICATDTNEIHYSINKSLLKLFDCRFPSHKLKLLKPNSKFFRIILKKLNLKPEETLFIDDKIININSAKKLKIKTILYEDYSKLRQNLKSIL